MLVEYMAECPYCGQTACVTSDVVLLPEEQREAAGKHCLCDGAKRARKLEDSYERIDQVCGAAGKDNGFEEPLQDSAITILRKLAENIIDDYVWRVALQLPAGNEIRMSKAGGDS